jgi:hypothetical protein
MPPTFANLAKVIFACVVCTVLPFMKAFPRCIRFYLLVAFFGALTIAGLLAPDKATSPESLGSKQVDPGWPREVIREGIRFVYYQPQLDGPLFS